MGNKRSFSSHVRWSKSEIDCVERLYPTASNEDLLLAIPGRTLSQIQNKAYGIGVARIKKPKMTPSEVRESKRIHMAKRRIADPEKARKYQNTRWHANRDRNLAVMTEYQRRRFFWIRATKLKNVTAKDLASLWKRQRGLCALTGRRLDRTAQLDHITAKARGGTDDLSNLRWLCKVANLALRELSDAEFLELCADCISFAGRRIDLAIKEAT